MKNDRDKDSISIADALANYFKAIGMEGKVHETRVLSRWKEVVGEAAAKRTENLYLKDKVLYVELNSSVMRDELQQNKTNIINQLNIIAQMQLIDDIFLK